VPRQILAWATAASEAHEPRRRDRIMIHRLRRAMLATAIVSLVAMLAAHAVTAGARTVRLGTTKVGPRKGAALFAGFKRANAYIFRAPGTITMLSVYLEPTAESGSEAIEGVIYGDAHGSPGRLLATSGKLTYSHTDRAGWYHLPLRRPLFLQPGKYWLGLLTGGNTRVAGYRWNQVPEARAINENWYEAGPSSPLGSRWTDDRQLSLYATYVPAGAPALRKRAAHAIGKGLYASARFFAANGSAQPVAPSGSTGASQVVSPLWSGVFACGCIDSRLYSYTSFVPGHVFPTVDPLGSGKEVLEYAISNSDQPYPGANPRGDVESASRFFPGDDVYFATPILVPTNFPLVPAGYWVMTSEVYGPPFSASPTNAFGIRNDLGDNRDHIAFGGTICGDHCWEPSSPINDGRWHTLILHMHFALDNTGFVEIWLDGVQQHFLTGGSPMRLYGPTMTSATYNGTGDFLDINSYREPNEPGGTVIFYHGAPVIGATYQSVESGLTNPPYGP
jgi:hypothetical protein